MEILDGFPTAFFLQTFITVVSRQTTTWTIFLLCSSRLFWKRKNQKNVWNNILIAPKKVPQKHNGILKFAQFIYFLQQLACLFCTITFPSLYLWTMPMDHLAWIMSWVPFFIQVPFFPFWWANENKSSLLTDTNEFLFFFHDGRKKWSYLSLTTYYILFEEILPSFVFVFFLYSELSKNIMYRQSIFFIFIIFPI